VTKKCNKCGQTKPFGEFSPHKGTKDGKQNHCRECHREYMRAYRQGPEHKAYYEARVQQGKDFVEQYAKETGQDKCASCSTTENLHWDHIDPATKSACVNHLRKDASKARIWAEIKKCQRLCHPCHVKKSVKNGELGHPSKK
jgi:hypothetical protein